MFWGARECDVQGSGLQCSGVGKVMFWDQEVMSWARKGDVLGSGLQCPGVENVMLWDQEGNVLESRGWCSVAEKALFLGIETMTVAPSNMFRFVLVRFPGALACCHVSCRTHQNCRPTHDVRSL